MELVKPILLGILFILHWGITAVMTLYVFFRKNNKYDWLYTILVSFVLLHWILSTECIISFLEKIIIDKSYFSGKDPTHHPSLFLYNVLPLSPLFITVPIYIFFMYNIYTMMRIYKLPNPIVYAIFISIFLYLGYWRLVDLLKTEVAKIKEYKKPSWLETNSYLNKIYEKKIDKSISLIDVINRVTCYVFPSCNTKQIDWNEFEQHCAILREKTRPETYDYVVGIESGGAFVGRALRTDCKYIKISKYDDNPNILGKPIIQTRDDLSMLRGTRVLVVDDQTLTGQTMTTARKYLLEDCGARHVDCAALYSRQSAKDARLDFVGLPFVISRSPWGYSA